MQSQDKIKELTRCGLFTAIALTIFMIETRMPPLLPIPGMKMGFSNAVTLYVAYAMGMKPAGQILVARIFLGAVFAGQFSIILYSAMGGVCSYLFLLLVRKSTTQKQLWFVSPCCAICHNIGQMVVGAYLLGSTVVLYFMPYLFLMAVVSGVFVGIITGKLLERGDLLVK